MIESIDDLNLKELEPLLENETLDEFTKALDARLQEKLNISLEQLQASLSAAIIQRAEELALDCPSIAPYNKYDTLLEDNDSMAAFFKSEASKPENNILYTINTDPKFPQLISFTFINKAVEDLKGTVFVSKSGLIRHSYPRIEV